MSFEVGKKYKCIQSVCLLKQTSPSTWEYFTEGKTYKAIKPNKLINNHDVSHEIKGSDLFKFQKIN